MPSRQELANAIRVLSMDAVQKANSGHPGMPMGMADIAEVLWNDFLVHHPGNPQWPNRDRFILSNGHGSMLQYALLYLTGYDVSIEDLKQFRKLHSKTPGHPEYSYTPGVETTTGPLGQGLANAVGMAIAEKHLAAQFNRPDFPIVEHYTYVFVGDGCLMEGISHEVCSLAGTLGLGKLIVIYDDNNISIDGKVDGWFTEHTPARFRSYNWHVVEAVDGHDSTSIKQALLAARIEQEKPSLICCKTLIGFGAPNLKGTAKTHGSPLGEAEIQAARTFLKWPHAPFMIPAEIKTAWDAREKGAAREKAWRELFVAYEKAHPTLAHAWHRRQNKRLPDNWHTVIQDLRDSLFEKKETMATRKASQICITHFTKVLPELMGGSADLSESNLTHWAQAKTFSKDTPYGQYIFYGVREFGMSAMMNGLALHGGILPFGGTFLTFSDYARNAIRLAAMMHAHVIFVYTHDSIGLGEDGPTHQPIEHIASLRLIPNLSVWRPADGVETMIAWQKAIEHHGPTCLLLSRQSLPALAYTASALENVGKGGYILSDCDTTPDIILLATGSEVAIALQAAQALALENVKVRVVSLPSVNVFKTQTDTYKEYVLPKKVTRRIAIEAGSGETWHQWVGDAGKVIGIDQFGASAPAKDVFNAFGFNAENILNVAHTLLSSR